MRDLFLRWVVVEELRLITYQLDLHDVLMMDHWGFSDVHFQDVLNIQTITIATLEIQNSC